MEATYYPIGRREAEEVDDYPQQARYHGKKVSTRKAPDDDRRANARGRGATQRGSRVEGKRSYGGRQGTEAGAKGSDETLEVSNRSSANRSNECGGADSTRSAGSDKR
jgi:hypothetical protein